MTPLQSGESGEYRDDISRTTNVHFGSGGPHLFCGFACGVNVSQNMNSHLYERAYPEGLSRTVPGHEPNTHICSQAHHRRAHTLPQNGGCKASGVCAHSGRVPILAQQAPTYLRCVLRVHSSSSGMVVLWTPVLYVLHGAVARAFKHVPSLPSHAASGDEPRAVVPMATPKPSGTAGELRAPAAHR